VPAFADIVTFALSSPFAFSAIKMTVVASKPLPASRASASAAPTVPAAFRPAISKSLLLRKVPRRCTIEDIRAVFEAFGAVRDVYIPMNFSTGRKETYAFIEYESLKDSMKAFDYLTKNEMLLEGIILRIDYARNGRRSVEQMADTPVVTAAIPASNSTVIV
jgi:RNA recognition motif-containing protein